MLKSEILTREKKGLHYLLDQDNKTKKYKPWLGDSFSFLYDRIMEKSIFPKKFQGSIHNHYDILKRELGHVQDKSILEIGAGSGNAVHFLNPGNDYTGVDISPGLLRKALQNFISAGFQQSRFYVADATDLPFQNGAFDVVMCHLSLNFIQPVELFIAELKRVIKRGGSFFCSVPVPEQKPPKVTIHGRLFSQEALKALFEKQGFIFEKKPYENGALIYFQAKDPEKNE